MALPDFDGLQLLDERNEPIGWIEQTYVDDMEKPRFVETSLVGEARGHRLVPLDWIEKSETDVKVPYSAEFVAGSPKLKKTKDLLDDDVVASVLSYYETYDPHGVPQGKGEQSLSETQEGDTAGGHLNSAEEALAGKDFGDVVEIPVIEEVLVKKPVVKEVIRVRKSVSTDTHSVSGDLRKEDVTVEKPQ